MQELKITLTSGELEALDKALTAAIRETQSVTEEEKLASVRDKIWNASDAYLDAQNEYCDEYANR